MTVKEIKDALLAHCIQVVENRYQKIKMSISDIEESMLEESKSSSGDKHETGRAMLQIDRENAGKQLKEIENLKNLIPRIDITSSSDYVRLGSLVYTNQGTYFMSFSIGLVIHSKTNYICIALHSPIGDLLSAKKKGDSFVFNGKDYKITSVK